MSKVCKTCRTRFHPEPPGAVTCGAECAESFAVSKRGKAEKVKAIKEKKETKEALNKLKSKGKLIAEAQTAFNAFIRARDTGMPCICCGREMGPQRPGGSIDAGHYLSRGSSAHLSFDERNVHAQRKDCNRPGGAKRAQFRAGMINRIGLVELEALECDQVSRHYSKDDYLQIKQTYNAKARALLKAIK